MVPVLDRRPIWDAFAVIMTSSHTEADMSKLLGRLGDGGAVTPNATEIGEEYHWETAVAKEYSNVLLIPTPVSSTSSP